MICGMGHMLGGDEALDMLGDLPGCEVLVVHTVKAQAIKKVLHFCLDSTSAQWISMEKDMASFFGRL